MNTVQPFLMSLRPQSLSFVVWMGAAGLAACHAQPPAARAPASGPAAAAPAAPATSVAVADTSPAGLLWALYGRPVKVGDRVGDDSEWTIKALHKKARAGGETAVLVELAGSSGGRKADLALVRPPRLVARGALELNENEAAVLDDVPHRLSAVETAFGVVVAVTSTENGPRNGSVVEGRLLLLRPMEGALQAVLKVTVAEDHSDAECQSTRAAELKEGRPGGDGFFDQHLTIDDSKGDFVMKTPGDESTLGCDVHTRQLQQTFRWDGQRYAAATKLPAFADDWP